MQVNTSRKERLCDGTKTLYNTHSTRWGSSVTNWLVNPTNYSYIPLSTLEFTLSYLRQHLAIVNGGLTLCAACTLYQLMRNLACPSSLSNWRGKKEPEVMIAGAKTPRTGRRMWANGALPVRQAPARTVAAHTTLRGVPGVFGARTRTVAAHTTLWWMFGISESLEWLTFLVTLVGGIFPTNIQCWNHSQHNLYTWVWLYT